jgi:hypothetical protein
VNALKLMTSFNTKPIQGEKPMNTFHARNPPIAACLATAGLLRLAAMGLLARRRRTL